MKSNAIRRLHFDYKPVDAVALTKRLQAAYTVEAAKQGIQEPSYDREHYGFTAHASAGYVSCMLKGNIAWGQCEVEYLAVNPFKPHVKGVGTAVMQAMEAMAREKGCHRLSLCTFSWEARPFYEKLGFHCFGTQEDYPTGYSRYFLEKVLADHPPKAPKDFGGELEVVPTPNVEETQGTVLTWLFAAALKTLEEKAPPLYVKMPFAVDICDKKDGTRVGGCLYETAWTELRINGLAIEPEHRGKGLGTLVLEDLQTLAKESQCNRLAADVLSYQALPFFEKQGLKPFGEQKDFVFPGIRKVFMEKRL